MEDNKKDKVPDAAETVKLPKQDPSQDPAGATSELPATEIPTDKQKIAKMETAEKRIEKSLSKQNVEHSEGEVHDALVPLYERYELTGTVPTQEAFAEACRNQNAGQHVLGMQKDPFRPTGKRNALIAAGCAAAALIIAGTAFAYSSAHQPAAPEQESKPAVAEVKQAEDATIHAKVNCDGWNEETSTPIVLSIYEGDVKDTLTSTDENVTAPDPMAEKQVKAGVDTEITEITDPGTYTLAIVGSPVLEDGTIFNLPEPQVVEYDGDKGESVELTLNVKPADQVTEADIVAAQATAVAAGADTEKVSNAASAANSKAASAQGGTVAAGSTTPSESAHQHNWVAKTVHHDAVYENQTTYIHHDAVYETKTISVCATCGAENPSLQHSKNHALNGQSDQVVEKQKRVLVKDAYDEPVTKRVLVKAAYDETTGYYCSTCGATK